LQENHVYFFLIYHFLYILRGTYDINRPSFVQMRGRHIEIIGNLLLAAILIYQIAAQRSVFIDEANLIRNIYEKSWFQLLQPLAYEQYCPPLYAWLVKGVTIVLGHCEAAYRIVSLCAAGLTIFSLRGILRKHTRPVISLSISLLLITNPYMLRYFTECKQYSMDVALTTLWLYLYHSSTKPTHSLIVLVLAIVSPWLSMASVFVIAAVGLIDLYQRITHRGSMRELYYIPISALSFGIYYWINLRHSIGLDYLEDVHAKYFVELLPTTMQALSHDGRLVLDWLAMSGNHTVVSMLCTMWFLLLGGRVMQEKSPRLLLTLAALMGLLWVACGMHLYLWRPRTLLFSQIVFYICVGYSLIGMRDRWSWTRYMSIGCMMILLVICQGRQPVWKAMEITDYKRAFAQMDQRDLPVYAAASAYPSVYYYLEIKKSYAWKIDLRHLAPSELSEIERPSYVLRGADWPKELEVWNRAMNDLDGTSLLSDDAVDLWLITNPVSEMD